MTWIREIEFHPKDHPRDPSVVPINISSRILLDIFGPRVFDPYKKTWVEDDVYVAWSRIITSEIAVKLTPFIEGQFVFDFQLNEYRLSTSEDTSESTNGEVIERFLAWFVETEFVLSFDYEEAHVVNLINDQLDKIDPQLAWEIGVANDRAKYFAVSPRLNEGLLPLAQQLVERSFSREFERFEFRLGRQRRTWSDLVLIVADKNAPLSEADVSQWKHLVSRAPDSELFDIVFECGEHCLLGDDELQEIAMLVVVGLLGEMTVIEKVNRIEVVRVFGDDRAKRAEPAQCLPYGFGLELL